MRENENQQPFTLPNRLRIACYAIWQNTFIFPVCLVLMLLASLASFVNEVLFLLFINLFAGWVLLSLISGVIFMVIVTSGWGLYCPACGNKLFAIQQPASIFAFRTIPLRYRLQMIHKTIRRVLKERRFTCLCCQTEYYVA